MRQRAAVALFFVLLLTRCATVPAAGGDRESLLQTDRAWSAAAVEGKDVERILAFWADDAVVNPPDGPAVRGKAAIRAYVSAGLAVPGFQISWEPQEAAVSGDGTLGYTTGTNRVVVPGPDGKLMTVRGRYATVWRRTGNEWKCVVDIWNSPPQ
jgi:ketosteroid isomerase-like protein